MAGPPLLIVFAFGTRVRQEAAFSTGLPIVGNGPPGTFVMFPGGRPVGGLLSGSREVAAGRSPGLGSQVPLPTDQIVGSDHQGGMARVAFGGMRFDGIEGGQLVFRRVRDLLPAALLSPERGMRMTLEPWMVAAVFVDGERAWPAPEALH
ncbi:MAG: hypothetical protein EXR72_15515 [Myxococcales bacterium]|nr:hypothetical protein [Myxococcales bacterium]